MVSLAKMLDISLVCACCFGSLCGGNTVAYYPLTRTMVLEWFRDLQ